MAKRAYEIGRGRPHPLGSTPDKNGVNFSVFSEHASSVELMLFENHTAIEPSQTIILDPKRHNSFHFWHVYVKGLAPGACYAFRVDGPNEPANGHRFNRNKVLVDPYSKGTTSELWVRRDATTQDDNLKSSMRSVVIDLPDYDWEGDKPINRPMNETVIYELHVGGFTKSDTSSCRFPGKFLGLVEKIPYLKNLGVTAVELMPVMDFDSRETRSSKPKNKPLKNYWGYGTIGYFAPESSYCISPSEGTQIKEFRDMVKAFHAAGIEVILDVVFGYTGEGDQNGPTISFRGFDNAVYYLLTPENKEFYMNYSGCGNTLKANHPIVGKFITDCLEFWVKETHVDGFRFDEGSILSRDENGNPMAYPPVLWNIELSSILSNTKIIAEAWDAAGLYQVGYFPGYRYAEWNGRFRDDVRRFVRGDDGFVGLVAERITGSPDLYQSAGRLPANSINFVTCHDGFTLNDLVSYEGKHNEANGNNNTDGINENLSSNYGKEGPTDDGTINSFRDRQIRNFFTILLLSRGTPMLSMGDEIKRTQLGNNNTYCQDNEISWFDWNLAESNQDLTRYVRNLISFRQTHNELHENSFYAGSTNPRNLPDISFHGCKLFSPGFNDSSSHILAYTLGGKEDSEDIHVMINMDAQDLDFEVPEVQGRKWRRIIDTSNPQVCFRDMQEEDIISGGTYKVMSHSIVVLISG